MKGARTAAAAAGAAFPANLVCPQCKGTLVPLERHLNLLRGKTATYATDNLLRLLLLLLVPFSKDYPARPSHLTLPTCHHAAPSAASAPHVTAQSGHSHG